LRKIRIAYENISFPNPIEEPFAEKSGDVCSASGVEDHCQVFTSIEFIFNSINGCGT
jgi:hypothetical protein